MKADAYVLCDTDLAFASNLASMAQTGRIRAKAVDLPNPRTPLLKRIWRASGIETTPKPGTTTCNQVVTLSNNCNGGVYIIPGRLAAKVGTAWGCQAAFLEARPGLIRGSRYVDQIAFGLALQTLEEDVLELPVEYNFPLHLPQYFGHFKFTKPQVLHHHYSFPKGCCLERTGHPVVDESIGEINQLLEHPNRMGYSYRPLPFAPEPLAGA